jgi:hypothetical protein
MSSMSVMTAAQVAAELRKRNIVVLAVHEGNDVEDGQVDITPIIHVQVPNHNDYGFSVVKQLPDKTFAFSPELDTIQEVVEYIENMVRK